MLNTQASWQILFLILISFLLSSPLPTPFSIPQKKGVRKITPSIMIQYLKSTLPEFWSHMDYASVWQEKNYCWWVPEHQGMAAGDMDLESPPQKPVEGGKERFTSVIYLTVSHYTFLNIASASLITYKLLKVSGISMQFKISWIFFDF